MSGQRVIKFQEVLEIVESLPESQQENLIDIIQCRLRDHRRDTFSRNIKKAKREYDRGEIKRGTVDDLMKELSE